MLRAFLSRSRQWLKLLLVSFLFGGSVAAHAMDTYDPATGLLTIPLVIVGDMAYTNVQVFVGPANAVTVGGGGAVLDAADTYDGTRLTIPAVQVGNTVYTNVQVSVGLPNVRAVGGSMPKPLSAPLLTLANPLPDATVGQAYAVNVKAAVWPSSQYTYGIDTLANGVLPSGMTIDLNGNLKGTPFATGRTDINGNQIANQYTFGVCATDTFSRVMTFPCPQTSITVNPRPLVTVTVAKAGTGSGSVASVPAGISCGATCSASAPSGTVVTLTATPAGGSTFAGWSGACSGTGSCVLTLAATANVTATFNLAPVVTADAVTPGAVSLGKAGGCTGGTLSTTFQVLAPAGVTWTATADPNNVDLGGRPLNVAPGSGSTSGSFVVTVTVPPQPPSSSYSSCSLQWFLDTFSNVDVKFSDGAVIGVTVYWTFVGTT